MKLWQRLLLNMIFPILIALGLIYFEIRNIRSIYWTINLMEAVDDIELHLLELRRYEKNLILFREEKENIELFTQHLASLREKLNNIRKEVTRDMNETFYVSLTRTIDSYEHSLQMLVSLSNRKWRLIEDIRALGRTIEKDITNNMALALELRRYEKNYIIYKEQEAIDALHRLSRQIATEDPATANDITNYVKSFDEIVAYETIQRDSLKKMRIHARVIEKSIMEFARKERDKINAMISSAEASFVQAALFIVISTLIMGYLVSRSLVTTLIKMEKALDNLAKDDFFSRLTDVDGPVEVNSLVDAYNRTVSRLKLIKNEVNTTITTLEEVNRELAERQEEIIESRKMAAMRLLAAEICHEISNPLTSLLNLIHLFYEEIPDDDPHKEFVQIMLKDSNRCSLVLHELADFARKEPLSRKWTKPCDLVCEAIEIVTRQVHDQIARIETSLELLPDTAFVDPVLLRQVFINILSNALRYTPASGTVSVGGYVEEGNAVFAFRDEGPGIEEENLPHIFEPFFSTCKESGGTGLGLAISKKIVDRHSGAITVQSVPGTGSTFTVRIPVSPEQQ